MEELMKSNVLSAVSSNLEGVLTDRDIDDQGIEQLDSQVMDRE
jgi:hypothetical protein